MLPGLGCVAAMLLKLACLFCAVILTLTLSMQAVAQEVANRSGRPPLPEMHQNADFSYYCDPNHKTQYDDVIKCIPLRPGRNVTLSLGGTVRQRGEYFDHPTWGQEPPNNGYSLQRYMLYENVQVGTRFRFFSELESGLEYGRDPGPRPVIDRDALLVHQTFGDVNFWQSGKDCLRLRVGRQELSFGADRLVSIREGPNVRQNFDGFRLTLHKGAWDVDLFATKYSENHAGVFSDPPNHAYSFWGLYTTHRSSPGRALDLYYLGTDHKNATFQAGTAREQRETVGARFFGNRAAFDYDSEGVFQFGRFGSGNIRAFGLAENAGWTHTSAGGGRRVRLGMEGGVASGDRNPNDHTLGTYNALFPKGAYFSEAELLGPYNIVHVRPNVKFFLPHDLTIWPDLSYFWRESRADAIYGVPEVLLRKGNTGQSAYIGSHANVQIDWHPSQHFTYTLIYLHFFPGSFLKETKPAKNVNFVAPWITYNF